MYFNLKEPKGKKDTKIIFRYFISKSAGRFVFSTKLSINPNDWDKDNKIAKATRGRSDLSSINRKLQKYLDFFEKTLIFFELNDIKINKEILKRKFNDEFNNNNIVAAKFTYFTDFATDFIKNAPNFVNRITNKKYNKNQLKKYNNSKNRLLEFQENKKIKIKIDGFSLEIYDRLIDFLKFERNYAINTIGCIIKDVKVLLKKAEEFGYTVNEDYKSSSFSVLRASSPAVALNESEIERIFNFDFSDNKRLENCRDIAIIGLWTGLRVSDFLTLPEIKQNEKFITVQPKKTSKSSGIKVVIPLHYHIKDVIKKRGMPRMISDAKFNKYFKEICQEVGLVELTKGAISVKDDRNNCWRKKVDIYPKYKLISSHTCRRSFATNLYKMNFPTLSIMAITGHTTEKSFLLYIKVTPTEHAEKLLKHWEMYYANKK